MAKTETIHMRVAPEIKNEADNILTSLGITIADAINIFLVQVILTRGLPFEVRLPTPNETTKRAMREAENNVDLKRFDSASSMFKELGIE